MQTFFITLLFFVVVIAMMAIGVIIQGKPIKGSCGGIGALFGFDGCMFCTKKKKGECPVVKKKSQEEA